MPPLDLPVVERKSLDNSILSTQARCPRLTYYNYVLNRAPRAESYPINFGQAYHTFREVLEKEYRRLVLEDGEDFTEDLIQELYDTATGEAIKGWENPPIEHRKSYLDLTRLLKTFKEALEIWENEKRTGTYKVIGTESGFELELPSGRLFSGRLDQILEWNYRLWIRDFKTTGRKDDWNRKFNPDHQFTGYTWAAQMLSGRRVDGAIIDIVYNIKTKGPEFHPTLASRTEEDIKWWLEWVEDEYDLFQMHTERDYWPMKTSACGDFGGCFFRECCSLGNWSSVEAWLEESTIHSEWDPLDPAKEKGLPE